MRYGQYHWSMNIDDARRQAELGDGNNRPEEIILVPGLLEPAFAMVPLRWSLRNHCRYVECWRDRCVFRNLEHSVDRMVERISGDPVAGNAIGIVTHSFGDWIVRAAIARSPSHRVTALVSLAPLMRFGFLTGLLSAITGDWIPEVAVIMDRDRASANADCDSEVRRLVLWSGVDESLRSVDLSHVKNLEARHVLATHLSIPLQPNVHHAVADFLFGLQGCPAVSVDSGIE